MAGMAGERFGESSDAREILAPESKVLFNVPRQVLVYLRVPWDGLLAAVGWIPKDVMPGAGSQQLATGANIVFQVSSV